MAEARTITRNQYLQVEGLLVLAQRHKKTVDECVDALTAMLEPGVEFAHSGDAVWEEYSAVELLEKIGITVVSPNGGELARSE